MNRWGHAKRSIILSSAVALWLSAPLVVWADNATVTTDVVHVKGTWAEEAAKLDSRKCKSLPRKRLKRNRRSPSKTLYLLKQVYLELLMLWAVLVYPSVVPKRVTH